MFVGNMVNAFCGYKLFEFFDQLNEFVPFFFEEMDGHIVQIKVIGRFSIRFICLPDVVILGFYNGFGFHLRILRHFISPFQVLELIDYFY
jgi:hypothetical protein